MNSDSKQLSAPIAEDQNPVVPARIGQRWGMVFWVPVFLLLAFFAAISLTGNPSSDKPFSVVVFSVTLVLSLLVLLFAGRWWATRGLQIRQWGFLLAAIVQGLALLLSFFLAIAAAMWVEGTNLFKTWTLSDFDPIFVGWGVCSIWTLALGAVVVWRVHRAAMRATDRTKKKADAPSNDHVRVGWSFAIELALSVGIPLLLSVPIVMVLHYDASLRRSANSVLTTQIRTINAQLADIKDLEKVKSLLLARKQIVQTLEAYASRAADVFGLLEHWPNGVQLLSLDMKESQIAFVVRAARPATELAVIELLAQSGYRDLRIVSRQRQSDSDAGQVTIQADSTRVEER